MKFKVTLVLILIIAAVVRLWQIDVLPQRMFGDEVDVGYHAWSLWTTGRDYTGKLLPTYIRSLSEYRAPLLMYAVAPFVGLIGPSNLATRLPSAVFGVLSILLIYMVALKLFSFLGKKESLFASLISAFVLAISPWHIHYSRTAFEVSLLCFLILFSLTLYFYIDQSKKSAWFLLPLTLTFYTYSTATVFVPLFVLGLLMFDKGLFRINKQKIIILLLAGILVVPAGLNIINGKASARFGLISIFGNQKLIDEVIVSRTKPWSNSRDLIFNNKYIRVGQEFVSNYIGAWSPEFLFVKGDIEPRHNIFGFGEFPIVFVILLVVGIASLIYGGNKETKLLGYLLLVSPISSSMTYGGASHATRLFIFLPFLSLAMGLGAAIIYKSKYSWLNWFIVIFSLISFIGWWRQMDEQYRFETQRSWQYGYEEIFTEFRKIDDQKGRVFVNNTKEPSLIRFAFYTHLSPVEFQRMFVDDKMTDIRPGLIGFTFGDRYIFGKMMFESMNTLESGDYYIAAQGQEIPGDMDLTKSPLAGFDTLKKVSDAYGLPLFYILRKK